MLALSMAGVALAAPVDCTNTTCQVTDNGWTISTDGSEQDLENFEHDGVDHLSEEEFHLDFGDAGIPDGDGDRDISSTLDKVSATADEATNTITSVFTDEECLDATVTRKLTGSGASALLEESLALHNTCVGGGAIDMWVVEWSDFDLTDSSDDDTGSFDNIDSFHLSDGATTASIKTLQAVTSYDIADCLGSCETTILDSRPSSGKLAGSSGPVGPDDLETAFHFDVAIAPQSTVTLRFEKRISVNQGPPEIPTLGPTGIVALVMLLAGIAVVVLARRQRAVGSR